MHSNLGFKITCNFSNIRTLQYLKSTLKYTHITIITCFRLMGTNSTVIDYCLVVPSLEMSYVLNRNSDYLSVRVKERCPFCSRGSRFFGIYPGDGVTSDTR